MKITKSTIVRTILFLIVILNFILERCGIDVIATDENAVAMVVEYIVEIAVLAVGFWKNNSFSPKAIIADEYLKELKESE